MSRRFPGQAWAALLFAGATAAGATDRYVAWGDSITEGIGDEADKGGYVGRLETSLKAEGRDVVVENWGLGGERTDEALSRINTLSGATADTFILMEGTNDCIGTTVSVETIAQNLEKLLNKARAKGFGHVMLSTIIPISNKSSSPNAPQRARYLGELVRQRGYELDIDRPDAERGMADLPNLYADYYSDGKIHPNAAGYGKLADVFLDYIQGRDTEAPAPSFVSPAFDAVVPPNEGLEMILFDPLSGVDFASATLTVNGAPVETDVTGDVHRAVLRARPGNLSGKPALGVRASDQATPANSRDEIQVTFRVDPTAALAGDINLSGRIDGTDLVLLGRAFGSTKGSGRYLAAADFDDDGTVDGNDLAVLAANFGESSN